MGLKQTFQKQGGANLIRQYWQSGCLFTAAAEFCLLGKSRTALEILRLSAQFKTRRKLEKKYKNSLIQFDASYDHTLPHVSSDKVWICWLSGMENAPEIVQLCYRSAITHLRGKEIILLTRENIADYVTLPDYILTKWHDGLISDTHFTDILRLELLIRYGGMWLDATVFLSGDYIPDYFFESDLFFYQCLKPGRDGHSTYISSWLMSAKTNQRVLMATQHLLYEYWKDHGSLTDYFLLHDFMSMVLEYYPDDWRRIIPRDNATPHILLLRLFDSYDETLWNAVTEQTPFHKLTYKFGEDKAALPGTFYQVLLKQES